MMRYLILILCVLVVTGCELMKVFGVPAEVADNPAVRDATSGVISNVMTANWPGAAMNLAELLFVSLGTWKATNISRDRRRKKRGEPVKAIPTP